MLVFLSLLYFSHFFSTKNPSLTYDFAIEKPTLILTQTLANLARLLRLPRTPIERLIKKVPFVTLSAGGRRGTPVPSPKVRDLETWRLGDLQICRLKVDVSHRGDSST